jgi:hypothetical protein
MNRCIPLDQLYHLVADQISVAERQALEAHVDGCADCQAALARLLEETEGKGAGLDYRRLRPGSGDGPRVTLDPVGQ